MILVQTPHLCRCNKCGFICHTKTERDSHKTKHHSKEGNAEEDDDDLQIIFEDVVRPRPLLPSNGNGVAVPVVADPSSGTSSSSRDKKARAISVLGIS